MITMFIDILSIYKGVLVNNFNLHIDNINIMLYNVIKKGEAYVISNDHNLSSL